MSKNLLHSICLLDYEQQAAARHPCYLAEPGIYHPYGGHLALHDVCAPDQCIYMMATGTCAYVLADMTSALGRKDETHQAVHSHPEVDTVSEVLFALIKTDRIYVFCDHIFLLYLKSDREETD
jgi:hypothetical protein